MQSIHLINAGIEIEETIKGNFDKTKVKEYNNESLDTSGESEYNE